MRKPLALAPFRTPALALALAVLPGALALPGCTDLTEVPPSDISPSNFYQNDQQVLSGLAGAYSGLRAATQQYYNISQVSSDETIVPTRGNNWQDNGKWVELWTHTYGPNSAVGNDDVNGAYANLFTQVARANTLLAALEGSSVSSRDIATAEVRALRAYYYYCLQDLFGGVPVVTSTEVGPKQRESRDSVFNFIESELLAVRGALPATRDPADYGRLTQGAVDAMLASLYTNAPVFTGTPTVNGITPGEARWNDVLAVTERILNSGNYRLLPNWRDSFAPNNASNFGGQPENIMVVRGTPVPGLGLDLINRAVHYNSFQNPGGWNGFSTIAETYNQFDASDARRAIFLVGPQNTLDTGAPVLLADGTRLTFTPTISSLTSAADNEGVRVVKFTFDPNHVQQNMGNDFTIFRLGEIYLMRAEALNELNRTAEAVALVNQLRERVYSPPQPLTGSFTQATFRQQLLRERLNELMGENKRRQDLIRLGDLGGATPTYTGARLFKPQDPNGSRVLFPIPQQQLQSNPLLTQNPGYTN